MTEIQRLSQQVKEVLRRAVAKALEKKALESINRFLSGSCWMVLENTKRKHNSAALRQQAREC